MAAVVCRLSRDQRVSTRRAIETQIARTSSSLPSTTITTTAVITAALYDDIPCGSIGTPTRKRGTPPYSLERPLPHSPSPFPLSSHLTVVAIPTPVAQRLRDELPARIVPPKPLLLRARIPHKRPQRERVRDEGRDQDLHARPRRPRPLVPLLGNHPWRAIQRGGDVAQSQRKKQYQDDLLCELELRGQDDRDGEDDKQHIREGAADGGGEQVGVALATRAAGVGGHGPVLGERGPAFGEVGDQDREEGGGEGAAEVP